MLSSLSRLTILRKCVARSNSHEFTHVHNASNQPRMVDVGNKKITLRTAIAESLVKLPSVVSEKLEGNEIQTKKGPVFATAVIAGTLACKKTSDLIPFCHPLHLTKCDIDITTPKEMKNIVRIVATVEAEDKTGVEMEALTAVSLAALTVYDMCKSVAGPDGLTILETKLLSKSGGKTDFRAPSTQL